MGLRPGVRGRTGGERGRPDGVAGRRRRGLQGLHPQHERQRPVLRPGRRPQRRPPRRPVLRQRRDRLLLPRRRLRHLQCVVLLSSPSLDRVIFYPDDTGTDFRLGATADIQLEFRTTELNGVLLSVSERKGSPSLSLSIDDGTVSNQSFLKREPDRCSRRRHRY